MTREQDDDILFRYHDGDILTPEEHARVEDLMKRELKKNRRRPSGGQQTAHIRLARLRERQADRGLKRVEVVVPEALADEIREIAAQMRQENAVTHAFIIHTDSGHYWLIEADSAKDALRQYYADEDAEKHLSIEVCEDKEMIAHLKDIGQFG